MEKAGQASGKVINYMGAGLPVGFLPVRSNRTRIVLLFDNSFFPCYKETKKI